LGDRVAFTKVRAYLAPHLITRIKHDSIHVVSIHDTIFFFVWAHKQWIGFTKESNGRKKKRSIQIKKPIKDVRLVCNKKIFTAARK